MPDAEAKKSVKPHTTGMQDHNSDLSVVPNWVLGWIKDKKLTESYLGTVAVPENVPAEVIVEAVRHETGMAKAVEFMNKTKGP
jgi:hypothetical protein